MSDSVIENAKAFATSRLEALNDLDKDQLEHLANVGNIMDPDTDSIEHDDEVPKLTKEEWEYVQRVVDSG